MIVACCQWNVVKGQWQANADRASQLVREADADLVVLPELAFSGYFFESTDRARELAEPVPDGPSCRLLADLAAETGSTLVAGILENGGETLYNSAVVVTPRGVLGTYRKTHLYYEETMHFAPGDSGFAVWTVADREGRAYRLGVMICYDWFFPEALQTLALHHGADIIAHPSNLVMPHCPDAMPYRALENGVFTATANRTGTESNGSESLRFIGQSVICSPGAETLARAPDHGHAVIRAAVNPAAARDKALNRLNDRRTDRREAFYGRPR